MTQNGSSEVDLSIVVPAFNEEQRLPASLSRIAAWLAARTPPLSAEVLVVDDGSADGTARVAQDSATPAFPLRVLRHDANRGKGAAVRTGVLASRGRWVLVTDADLSTPIEEVEKLLAAGTPVAIGSRAVDPALVKEKQPLYRVLMGKLFNLLVRVLCVGGIRDTQCGFKLFSREAGREVFSRSRVDRFAWDVEALLLSRRLGYRIAEVPVLWFHVEDSRVSLGGGAQAYLDLFRIRRTVARTLRESPPPPRG